MPAHRRDPRCRRRPARASCQPWRRRGDALPAIASDALEPGQADALTLDAGDALPAYPASAADTVATP